MGADIVADEGEAAARALQDELDQGLINEDDI